MPGNSANGRLARAGAPARQARPLQSELIQLDQTTRNQHEPRAGVNSPRESPGAMGHPEVFRGAWPRRFRFHLEETR